MPVDPKRRLGGATTPTAAPSAGAATAPAVSATQPAAQKQVGTGFVNMSDILAANQSGAKAMGQALASSVQQQGQSARAGIDGASNAFAQQVAQGTPGYKEKGLNNRDDLRQRAARGYSGPRTWAEAGQDTAALAGQAARAQDNARALTTQGGRAALLQQQAPGLTAGGASLDAFLAGAGMGGQQQQIAADYGNLSDILAGQQGNADEQVAAAEARAKDVGQRYRDLEERWNFEDRQREPSTIPAGLSDAELLAAGYAPEDIAAQRQAAVRRNRPGVNAGGTMNDYSDRRSRRNEVP